MQILESSIFIFSADDRLNRNPISSYICMITRSAEIKDFDEQAHEKLSQIVFSS